MEEENFFPLITLAKYPWLKQAKEWVKREGPSMDELLASSVWEKARISGIERVTGAIDRKDPGGRTLADKSDQVIEILSYPIARMIIVATRNPKVFSRYAVAEAKYAKSNLDSESAEFVARIASEMDFTCMESGGRFKISFLDWIRNAPTYQSSWKLVNQVLNRGMIVCNKTALTRLLQENLFQKIMESLKTLEAPSFVNEVFKEDLDLLRGKFASLPEENEKLIQGEFPPCIRRLISMVNAGINISHESRFTLVAFLNSTGHAEEEILHIFSSAPDFDLEKTQYQVGHIIGRISSTEYKPPGCAKLRTFGICPEEERDEICMKINHPLKYYRATARAKKEKKEEENE
jgi:DNA primase large subunit